MSVDKQAELFFYRDPFSDVYFSASNTRIKANNAGAAWMNNMLILVVSAPKIPATITQLRKKTLKLKFFFIRPNINPAARKPL